MSDAILLPLLDTDDEVVFPNDTGLAVIHASHYWKLRECEERANKAADVQDQLVAALKLIRDAWDVPDNTKRKREQRAKAWIASTAALTKATGVAP